MKVKGEGGILVLRLRRKITITSRWSWRLKFWESEQLLKPERATGVPGVDSAVKSSMTYPTKHVPQKLSFYSHKHTFNHDKPRNSKRQEGTEEEIVVT